MLNNVVIVGRATEIKREGSRCIVTIKTNRPYLDSKGKQMSDLIPCVIGKGFAQANEYLKLDDVIGIKGMVTCEEGKLEIQVIKMTFLSKGGE